MSQGMAVGACGTEGCSENMVAAQFDVPSLKPCCPVALGTSIYDLSLGSTLLALTLCLSTFNIDTLYEMLKS